MSNYLATKYYRWMAEQDFVDDLVAQWKRERPDLDLSAVATVGRIARLHSYLLRAVESSFAEHGLQVGEFDVLAALRRAGAPYAIKPSVLARIMLLSPAGMTSRLDRLEALGLVERRPDPDDRRSSAVVLTPKGFEVIEAAM